MFGNLTIVVYSICIIFGRIVGVQNTGVRICWENCRKSSVATGSAATILKKTRSCSLTGNAWRTPKLMKVAHNICKYIAIWLEIMSVQCIWYEERLYIDPYTSFCWPLCKFAISVMWLSEFTSPKTFYHINLPCELCLVWKTLFCY